MFRTQVVVPRGIPMKTQKKLDLEVTEKEKVFNEAKRICSNPDLMKKHFEKSKFCIHINTANHDKMKCSYAHGPEDYSPPKCFNGKFCNKNGCELFHQNMETIESYMKKLSITFPTVIELEKFESSNVNTKLCSIMKENRPCNKKNCGYAHSLWELKPINCNKQNCDGLCGKFHPKLNESLMSYYEKNNKIKLFMLRDSSCNKITFEEINKRMGVDEKTFIERIVREEREENEMKDADGFVDGKFVDKDNSDEDEDEDEDVNIIII
jgi:hypothetical protein